MSVSSATEEPATAGESLVLAPETGLIGQAAASPCIGDARAQLPANALRRELRGEPYAGKPHVRFGEGGVSFGSPPTSMDFRSAFASLKSRNTQRSTSLSPRVRGTAAAIRSERRLRTAGQQLTRDAPGPARASTFIISGTRAPAATGRRLYLHFTATNCGAVVSTQQSSVNVVHTLSVSGPAAVCIKTDATFTATPGDSNDDGSEITWSTGGTGTPDTGAGPTFTTQWSSPGQNTVTATDGCGGASALQGVNVIGGPIMSMDVGSCALPGRLLMVNPVGDSPTCTYQPSTRSRLEPPTNGPSSAERKSWARTACPA